MSQEFLTYEEKLEAGPIRTGAGKYLRGFVQGMASWQIDAAIAAIEKQAVERMRFHAFPRCEVCGAMIDDPEALDRCFDPDQSA